MSTIDNSSAEQLWYTWSDVGLSTVHAGFRIRAASPGLSEIYSERVKSMDRYMRYVLPPGTDRFAITPDMAPVCLAFIRTDWNNEYILVHKNYVGEDGVGRLGNFFVHVIALGNLSQYFSTADAIWLWDSDIWKTNDKEYDRRSNKLDPIPLKELQRQIDNFQPNFKKVRQYLPFVIEAYLTRKNKAPIYVAAPADNIAMIAILIAGLANWLPRQLVAGLTFSTYEPDVTKATTEIVGTSWILTPGKGDEVSQVFSPQFYRENLAVNCSTGDRSPLQGHPQVTPKPLAADFAAFLTESILTGNLEQLYALLELAEKSQTLDVDTFLRMYYNEIANTDSIVETDIEKYLTDPYLCLDRLSSRNFRKSIIERAAANRQWSENQLQRLLLALREQAQRESLVASPSDYMQNKNIAISMHQAQMSGSSLVVSSKRSGNKAAAQAKKNHITLAEALLLLAKRAIPNIIDAMKGVGAGRETVSGQNAGDENERRKKIDAVASLLSLMDSCLLSQNSLEVWKELFDQITSNRNAVAFLTAHVVTLFRLLEKWDRVFLTQPEDDNAMRSLLIIPWSHLGKFLKLNVSQPHRQWNVMAVERLITDPSLTPQIAQGLEQQYSREIIDLLDQLLQAEKFTIASAFIIMLIENSYPIKLQFAARIENLLAQIVRDPRFWISAKEFIITLTRNGYKGAEIYLNHVETLLGYLLNNKYADGLDLVTVLVNYQYPRKKNLVDILLRSNTNQVNLESILERVYRTQEELNAFFINDGSNYLSTPDQVRAMISLYQKLLPLPQRLERLFVLLRTTPDGHTILDGNTILELLNITPLEGYESARILEHYGKSYLQAVMQTPQLANKVVELYIQLVKLRYPDKFKLLCTLFTSATDPILLENLLSSAQLLLAESREFFRQYGSLPRYFPFFYKSPTVIDLFSRIAQQANTLALSGHLDLAMEKMHLLFSWLQPSQTQPPLHYETIVRILQAASLTASEQIDFLERYGEVYLRLYPQSPLLKEYVSTYVSRLDDVPLKQAETRNFFTFLTQKYPLQNLDTSTRNHIQYWAVIDGYFDTPTATSEKLKVLAAALYSLTLPKNEAFATKLAIAFVSCVRTSDDLSMIMSHMQLVPKIHVAQLLYTMAEKAAAQYRPRQSQNVGLLMPYLSFVLTDALTSFIPSKEGQRYFRYVFLDTLLYNIKELDVPEWKTLNELLTNYAPQYGLSDEALKLWQDYLKGLQLLDKFEAGEGIVSGVATSVAQPQPSSPMLTKSTKAPSWFTRLRHFQFTSDPSDYQKAKKALESALRSRQVDLIANAWEQYREIILASHPELITQDRQEKIDACCKLAQCCLEVAKNPLISPELAREIVKNNRNIELYHLKPSLIQIECIERAMLDAQGTGYSYQNTTPSPSGPLAGQNSSVSARQIQQGPNPIVLKSPSAPGVTRFDVEDDSKPKKKKK